MSLVIPSPTKTIRVPSSVTRVLTCATMARRLHAPLGVDERSSYDSYLTLSVGNTGNHRNPYAARMAAMAGCAFSSTASMAATSAGLS